MQFGQNVAYSVHVFINIFCLTHGLNLQRTALNLAFQITVLLRKRFLAYSVSQHQPTCNDNHSPSCSLALLSAPLYHIRLFSTKTAYTRDQTTAYLKLKYTQSATFVFGCWRLSVQRELYRTEVILCDQVLPHILPTLHSLRELRDSVRKILL